MWNYDTFHSEFGGHFVLFINTFRYNNKLLTALAFISGIYRIYLDRLFVTKICTMLTR